MRQRRHQDQVSTWTPRDKVLLYTCRLAATLVAGGDMGHVAEVLAPFPPSLADDERLFAAGPFTLADFIPLGDGSWQSNGFVAAGTGALGMGMLAASLAGNAAAKSRAQAAAAANAIPRWVPIAHGTVYVSRYGDNRNTPETRHGDPTPLCGPGVEARHPGLSTGSCAAPSAPPATSRGVTRIGAGF